MMESFLDEKSGYFYRVLSYLTTFIENGVKENSFTEKQAREDLQIALWYSYACMNIDEYEFYYRGVQWMRDSEKNAAGCGTWYYRFSIGLTYCGKLEEALRYAEQGALEEPDYPWIWLHLGKLRSHFGDRDGALAAAQRGLELVPGDHEFTTLRQEILNGATLQEMEYHWIHPDADLLLQKGLDADADSKLRAISCIVTNPEGLDRFLELFHPDPDSFENRFPLLLLPLLGTGADGGTGVRHEPGWYLQPAGGLAAAAEGAAGLRYVADPARWDPRHPALGVPWSGLPGHAGLGSGAGSACAHPAG